MHLADCPRCHHVSEPVHETFIRLVRKVATMDTNQVFEQMMTQVDKFHEKFEIPDNDGELPRDRMAFRLKFCMEEIKEIMDAYDDNQPAMVIDGFVDLIYVAIGAILEHGIDPTQAFDLVHDANMRKQRGMTKRGHAIDVTKPEGWVPPDHGPMLERVHILRQISEVFVDLTKLRIRKGANYNRGTVKRSEHFPLGHQSYFQMVWVKSIRIRSLVESLAINPADEDNTVKLIDRELNDLMNYACFWAESIRGLDVER